MVVHIAICDFERAQFRNAEAGVGEDANDGLISQFGGAGVGAPAPLAAAVGKPTVLFMDETMSTAVAMLSTVDGSANRSAHGAKKCGFHEHLVGAQGYEPWTSRTRTVRATKLRYAPYKRHHTTLV